MSDPIRQFESYINNLIAVGFVAQWIRVRSEWEPKIINDIELIVNECLRNLLAMIDNSNTVNNLYSASAWQNTKLKCIDVVNKYLSCITTTIIKMLSSEITCLYEILTLNHLIPGDANLGSLHPDPAHALARLAGGHALEAAVTRSLADFLLRVRDELERPRAGQSEPADLPQRLEALTASWQSRLEAVGRTAVHAAFNRTKLAISSRFA